MTLFAFTDVETTGLDPDNNFILEVGWVLTDEKFNQVSEPKTTIIEQKPDDWAEAWRQIDESPFLTNMHKTSGLYDAMRWRNADTAMDMKWALDWFVIDVDETCERLGRDLSREQVRLAGYSVSFDREFLRLNGWKVLLETKHAGFQMHHRIMDISSNIQLFEAAGVKVPESAVQNKNAHRALDDAMDSMYKAQALRDVVARAANG